MNELQMHMLIALRDRCIAHNDDLMDALQFANDDDYPMHCATRQLALAFRATFTHFSDSTVDDLLYLLDDYMMRAVSHIDMMLPIQTIPRSSRSAVTLSYCLN